MLAVKPRDVTRVRSLLDRICIPAIMPGQLPEVADAVNWEIGRK
jgi:hypothetical protein